MEMETPQTGGAGAARPQQGGLTPVHGLETNGTTEEPAHVFIDYRNELRPKVNMVQTDLGYFGVLHPEECRLALQPLSSKPQKTYDWEVRCKEHMDSLLFVDYIDYGFEWLFALHRSKVRVFRRELAEQNLVIPSIWTTDEWLQHRLQLYRRVFDNYGKKIVFIMVM